MLKQETKRLFLITLEKGQKKILTLGSAQQ